MVVSGRSIRKVDEENAIQDKYASGEIVELREEKKKNQFPGEEKSRQNVIYPTPVERTNLGGTDWVGHGSRR